MPVVYVIDKPAPVGYRQWTGENADEFAEAFGNNYNIQVMESGNLKLTLAQNPTASREFVVGTWIAGINNYLTDEQKSTKKQEVPGPSVKYLTEETP